MRVEKAIKNSGIGIITYLIAFLPQFFIRKFFLETLGEDILGLNSLFMNLISYLSIAEMGIGSAIIFSLYKPFAENDKIKIKGYLDYYRRFYKISGSIIFLLGIALLPFLSIFINNDLSSSIGVIRWYFVLFLINTYISYLFTYKFCLLNVAQEGYIVSIANTITKIIIALFQIGGLLFFPRFDIYILIQIAINLLQYIVLNRYINKHFSWINNVQGKISVNEKNNLIKNVKALFIHKIGSILVFGTDNIVISTFINLSSVARYNNYSMILNAVSGVIGSITGALTPSVGNLLVEKDNEEAYKVHQRIFFLNFLMVSSIIIILYNLISQFISLWLGNNATIDNFTLLIVLINFYFLSMRGPVEIFQSGSGRYHEDRFASIFEAVINLIFSIVLVKKLGLVGVFLGTAISNITVIFWVKPLITYKYVFNRSVVCYFKMYFKYILLGLIPFFITVTFTKDIKLIISFPMLITNGIINIIIIIICYSILFYKDDNFLYFKELVYRRFFSVKNNL